MPADGTPIARAVAQPQVVHWYTGVLQNSFVPLAPAGRPVADPCRALRIAWDEDTPAHIARLPAFHPWQVSLESFNNAAMCYIPGKQAPSCLKVTLGVLCRMCKPIEHGKTS